MHDVDTAAEPGRPEQRRDDAANDATPPDGTARRSAEGLLARPTRLLVLFVGVAAIAAALAVRQRVWYPQGDLAVFEFKLIDLVRDPPAVGAYSRFEWSHPGPVMYYAFWPFFQVFGETDGALLSAVVMWHGAFLAVGAWLAHRLRLGAGWYLLAMAVLVVGSDPALGLFPWNPYLNITVFPAFLVAAYGLSNFDRVAVAATAILGTVLVQNHVGLVVPVAAAIGLNAAKWTIDRRRWPRRSEWVSLGAAAAAAGLLWLAPLVQQLTRDPGNFGLLARFFTNRGPGADVRVGLGDALSIVAQYFSLRAPWMGGRLELEQFSGGISRTSAFSLGGFPFWLVVGVAAAALAWRRGSRLAWPLTSVLALTPVAVFAVASIAGPPFPYLLVWVNALSLAVAALTVGVIAQLGPAARPITTQWRSVMTVAVGGISVIVIFVALAMAPVPYADRNPVIAGLSRQLNERYDSDQPIYFANATTQEGRTLVSAVMLQLHHHGHPVATTLDERLALGTQRTRAGPDGATELIIAEGNSIEEAAKDPSLRRVAYVDEFTPAERRKLAELEDAAANAVREPDDTEFEQQVKAATLATVLKFRNNRLRVAVFERR